jgi:hypothetical protein
MVHSPTRRLLTALALASLVGGNALAADAAGGKAPAPDAANPIMVLGATRAQAESDISELAQVADGNVSGWRVALTKTEYVYRKSNEALQEAMSAEERKNAEKDQVFIDLCREQMKGNDSAWQDYAMERTQLETRYGATWNTLNSVRGAFDNLTQFERAAKEVKLELTSIIALYAALDDKAKTARQQAQAALADVQARQVDWEARLKKSVAVAKREKAEAAPAPVVPPPKTK